MDRNTGTNGHVGMFAQHMSDEHWGRRRVIGAVAIRHDVNVGIDIGEHAPHHMAFAALIFNDESRTRRQRFLSCEVGRSIIEDMDRGGRQRMTKIADDLADGSRFIEAR
jgi:hypothetical protein